VGQKVSWAADIVQEANYEPTRISFPGGPNTIRMGEARNMHLSVSENGLVEAVVDMIMNLCEFCKILVYS
jgi:hypothetical protein